MVYIFERDVQWLNETGIKPGHGICGQILYHWAIHYLGYYPWSVEFILLLVLTKSEQRRERSITCPTVIARVMLMHAWLIIIMI